MVFLDEERKKDKKMKKLQRLDKKINYRDLDMLLPLAIFSPRKNTMARLAVGSLG